MNNTAKQEFLKINPEDNTTWVAKQLVAHFTENELKAALKLMEIMNTILYKSWVDEMPFKEIKGAFALIDEVSKK